MIVKNFKYVQSLLSSWSDECLNSSQLSNIGNQRLQSSLRSQHCQTENVGHSDLLSPGCWPSTYVWCIRDLCLLHIWWSGRKLECKSFKRKIWVKVTHIHLDADLPPMMHPYTRFDGPTMCSHWKGNSGVNMNISHSSGTCGSQWPTLTWMLT